MKNLKINRKRITALTLSMMLVLQQSFALQVLATSITNADKTPIAGSGNTWNITPDAVNGDVGFKQFGEINLDQNNILNFIYTYLPQRGVSITWNEDNHNNDTNVVLTNNQTIDTFVNLVDGGVNINGIVNTLESVGGGLKSNGNLIFVTPNGFVVGASGVINAGNLAVFTPTTDSYTDLKNTLALPQSQPKVITVVNHVENNPVTPNAVAELSYEYGNTPVAETTNATFELRLTGDNAKFDTAFYTPDGNPNHEQQLQFQGTDVAQYITNNGQIIARGNVLLSGGKIDVSKGTNTTGIMAGVSNNDVLTTNTDAEVLFSALVNTNNNEVTTYNADKGNIFTTSYVGTNMGENTHVRNLARNGEIKVRDFGRGGINFEGTLYNNNLASMNTQYGIYIWNANTSGTNTDPGITVTPSADIKNNGQLQVYNSGAGGMNIEGKFYNNIGVKRNDPTVLFQNIAGDMKIGHNYVTTGNIESNIGDVKIDITGGGSLLNNGVAQKHIVTTYGADLDISVVNGSIGDNIRGCDGGVCTGIGRDARDLTKSVNTSIDGKIKAISKLDSNEPGYSSDKVSLANIASLGIDMHVDQIKADGKVILLADSGIKTQSSYTGGTVIKTTGLSGHSILNTSTDSSKPNVEGTSISMIASKDIGETGNPLTFRQNGTEKNWDGDNATLPHVIDTEQATGGVDMLAKGNIDVYGMDADDGTKMNTNVCAIIARGDYGEGHINAEFSGDVYIEETIAPSTINITTRGKHMVVNHLGEAPHTYSSDYGETDYYAGKTSAPTKAKLVALDLGSELIESEKPKYEHAADSTIVVYNGTINGQGNGRPAHEQDLTLVADNAYAGGYYFNLGKHRGEVANENPSNPTGHKWNPSTVTEDNRTNPIMNEAGTTTASIRGKAVRPVDVTAIRPGEEDERNYYYGGSEQGGDPGYDGVNNEELNGTNDPDKQQTTEDDDNLVIPKNEPEPEEPIQLDSDTDTDVDTDIDNDTDTDNDIDTDTDTDNDIDTDTDIDTDNDTDNDDEIDIPDPEEQQVDTDDDTDTDVDTDIDSDSDSDTDIDNDTDMDTDTDTDNDIDTDTDIDTDNDTDNDTDTDMDTDSDTDTDVDTDIDSDSDSDTDIDNDTDIDTDTDTDNDIDTDTDIDTDSDTDIDTDNDTDSDTDTDVDTDIDSDSDSDTDIDNDTDMDTDTDTDNDIDTDTDIDTDNDTDNDTDIDIPEPEPEFHEGDAYKQNVRYDWVDAIDKRQYIRFDTNNNSNVISFESNEDVISISDISRGGVSLRHKKSLRVGDIVPIHLQYGDLEINANVQIVSASDSIAGGKFIDLDLATANKLLYLSLLVNDEPIAQTIQNISATSLDE